MFLSHAKNHTDSTYRMLNIHTQHIVLIREVIWLKKTTESTYQENKIPRQTPISYKIKNDPIIGIT